MTTKQMLIWLAVIALVAVGFWYLIGAVAPGPEDYSQLRIGARLFVA